MKNNNDVMCITDTWNLLFQVFFSIGEKIRGYFNDYPYEYR